MITTLYGGGINSTWYLECELHDDDTVTILRHYRLHNERDANHPATSSGFRIIESEPVFQGPYQHDFNAVRSNRDAIAVITGRKNYKVRNIKNVFAYN